VNFDKALAMRKSDIAVIFGSKAFSDWKKSKEAEGKMNLAICDRLDNLIRAVSGLGKAMTAR